MLGSLLYTYITAHWFAPSSTSGSQKHARSASVSSPSAQGDSSLVLHAQLSSLVCAAAAVTFAACVSVGKGKGEQGEHLKFWAFCLFEACVGMYYPVQGMLRGSLIANEHRATVSPLALRTGGRVLRAWHTAFLAIPRTIERVCRRVTDDGRVFCSRSSAHDLLHRSGDFLTHNRLHRHPPDRGSNAESDCMRRRKMNRTVRSYLTNGGSPQPCIGTTDALRTLYAAVCFKLIYCGIGFRVLKKFRSYAAELRMESRHGLRSPCGIGPGYQYMYIVKRFHRRRTSEGVT